MDKQKLIKIRETLSEIDIEFSDFSLVQDNKLLFNVGEGNYRVAMPSQKQFNKANQKKNECYVCLIQTEGCVTKKKLIKILKENQDIDVDDLIYKKKELQNSLEACYFSLYDTKDESDISAIEVKIDEIKNDFKEVSTEIVGLLSSSIEDQVEKEYVEYLAYTCTEKLVDSKEDTWEKHWKDYESFQNDNSKTVTKAIVHVTYLLMNTEDR